MAEILLVEDDFEICEILQYHLRRAGKYALTIVHNAGDALPLIEKRHFDLMLLDIMLPGEDGISFCEKLRSRVFCPILFISCLNDDDTIARALNMGGDDYLVKPFSGKILLARIEANLRRAQMSHGKTGVLAVGDLLLNPDTRSVQKDGAVLILSPTEYELLYHLMLHRGEFLSFESVYRAVWQRPSFGDVRTLFAHIKNLRKKIERDPANPIYIRTHMREGYIFLKE